MSLGSLLDISKLGIFASQGTLQTISHNISNVNTPGYTRQTVELTSLPSYQFAEGGSGVRVTDVRQQLDQLVDRRLELGTGEMGRLETRDKYLQMVENVFNEMDGDGLSQRLEAFYDAADTLADNPANAVARYQLVAKADAVTKQLNGMYQDLNGIAQPLNREIDVTLADVNTRLKAIQEITNTIVRNHNTNPALDLQDQRRKMIQDLGKLIDIRTVDLKNGEVQIMSAREQELLADSVFSATLSRSADITSTGFQGIKIGERPLGLETIRGGQLGGLLELRDQVINGAQGYLTRLETLTDELRYQANRVHTQSVNKDMSSTLRGIMDLSSVDTATKLEDLVSYDVSASALLKGIETTATGSSVATLVDNAVAKTLVEANNRSAVASAITSANLTTDATDTVAAAAVAADTGGDLTLEEARVIVVAAKTLNAGGTVAQAYAAVANGLKTPDDIKRITSGNIILAYGTNGNNLTPGTAVSITRSMTLTQVLAAFNAAGTGVTASINAENRLQLTAATSGQKIAVINDQTGLLAALGVNGLFGGRGAQDMAVNANIMADADLVGVGRLNVDSLTSPQAVSFDDVNSQGALKLGGLRTDRFTLFGNSATLTGHYATLSGEVGGTINQNRETLTAHKAAQSFIADMRESISGVSLEEELTDLIRFQRAFQASSKMVGVADELMQTIIKMV
ncbi:MAG: flagellar hook-associated protein FlgK [Magnetococcales bacterium]|nr:flagellar hook-associated protein FlgK [Magnetococcales bacterium]